MSKSASSTFQSSHATMVFNTKFGKLDCLSAKAVIAATCHAKPMQRRIGNIQMFFVVGGYYATLKGKFLSCSAFLGLFVYTRLWPMATICISVWTWKVDFKYRLKCACTLLLHFMLRNRQQTWLVPGDGTWYTWTCNSDNTLITCVCRKHAWYTIRHAFLDTTS